ncbi:MAG: SpvB/TcaC N-terminal domain-containing protein, partial [Prosthecobacter sp.]
MYRAPSVMCFLRGHLFRDATVALMFGGLCLQVATAADPLWWQQRQAADSNRGRDDYAAVNQGQFKNFVRAAIEEMNAELPGGAGGDLEAMLAGWRTNAESADNYLAVNQGQVKNVVKMIYTRLKDVGYATAYPWSHGERAAQDYALANIGQLKNLLSFDFKKDADLDGMADWLGGVGGVLSFDAANWLPINTAGSLFADPEHHSRSGELGYAARGGPVMLPPNPEGIQNDSVTSIPGEFKVGQDGSASYTVRIETPKGIANVEPGITLEYNSNSGNGIAGVGWGIGGVTVINRGPATFEVDGFYDPADFDENDRFYLDGERLLCVSGSYGEDGSEYRTQKEQFSKVVFHKPDAESGGWFEVWTKAGLRMEFGNCPTACINSTCPQETAQPFTWAVNKVSDNLGNYWVVTYCDTSSLGPPVPGIRVLPDYAPESIKFTGTTTGEPAHEIAFHYEARPDLHEGYLLGSLVRKIRRLQRIEVRTGLSVLRTYALEYEQSSTTGRSLLTKLNLNAGGVMTVAEKGAQPWRVVPPTVFEWDEGSTGWSDSLYDGQFQAGEKAQETAKLKNRLPYPVHGVVRPADRWPYQPGWGGVASVTSMGEYGNAGVSHVVPWQVEDYDGDGLRDVLMSHRSPRYESDFVTYDHGFPAGVHLSIGGSPYELDVRQLLKNGGQGRWQPIDASNLPWMSNMTGPASMISDVNSDGQPDLLSTLFALTELKAFHGTIYSVFLNNGGFDSMIFHQPATRAFHSLGAVVPNPTGVWLGGDSGPVYSNEGTANWGVPMVPVQQYAQVLWPYSGYIYYYPYGGPSGAVVTGHWIAGQLYVHILWPYISNGSAAFVAADNVDLGWRQSDLNGDGHVDLIRGGQEYWPATEPMQGGRGLCFGLRNLGPDAPAGSHWAVETTGIWQLPLPLVNSAGDKDIGRRLMDVNGDRLPDFVFQRNRPVPAGEPAWPADQKYELAVYLNRGNEGWVDGGAAWVLPGQALAYDDLGTRGRGFMDINGDQLPDFVASWKYKDSNDAVVWDKKVFLNTGSGWTADQVDWHLPLALQAAEHSTLQNKVVAQTYHRFIEDVNGDGQPDLIDAWADEQAGIDATPAITAPRAYFKRRNASGW